MLDPYPHTYLTHAIDMKDFLGSELVTYASIIINTHTSETFFTTHHLFIQLTKALDVGHVIEELNQATKNWPR